MYGTGDGHGVVHVYCHEPELHQGLSHLLPPYLPSPQHIKRQPLHLLCCQGAAWCTETSPLVSLQLVNPYPLLPRNHLLVPCGLLSHAGAAAVRPLLLALHTELSLMWPCQEQLKGLSRGDGGCAGRQLPSLSPALGR